MDVRGDLPGIRVDEKDRLFFSFAYSMAADSALPSCSASLQTARIISAESMICRYAVGKASSDSVWQAVTMQEHCSSTEKYRSLRYGGHLVAHSSCGVTQNSMRFERFPHIISLSDRKAVIEIFNYDPLWETMKRNNVTQYQLLKGGIDNRTLDSLKKNKNITMITLEKLCRIVGCTPNDIVSFQ